MNLRMVVAILACVAAGAVSATVTYLLLGGTDAPAPAPVVRSVTVTVGAGNVLGDATITYSCPSAAGVMSTCTAIPTNGVWSTTLYVQEGARVDVNVRGGLTQGRCWISDASDQIVYTEDATTGRCHYTVPAGG
jgi:hypothetical protein